MGVAALAVTISGIMAWQAVTSHRATTALELSRSQVAENAVSWFAHQAETELLRLALKADIALQEQREGPGGPVPDASGPDASGPGATGPAASSPPPPPASDGLLPSGVRLQYEITWSRLDLLNIPSFLSRLDESADPARHHQALIDLRRHLDRLDRRLGGPGVSTGQSHAGPIHAIDSRDGALESLGAFAATWAEPIRSMGRDLYAHELKLRPEMTLALRRLRDAQLRQRLIFAAAALFTGLGSALGLRWCLRLANGMMQARAAQTPGFVPK